MQTRQLMMMLDGSGGDTAGATLWFASSIGFLIRGPVGRREHLDACIWMVHEHMF